MSSLDDAERAYVLAILYKGRGDLKAMAFWIEVYEELLRDARTRLQTSEDQPVRLVSRDLSLCVSRVFGARGFRKVTNGTPTTHGNRSRSSR